MKTGHFVILAGLILLGAGGCVDRNAQSQAKKTAELVTDPRKTIVVANPTVKTISETLEITGDVTTSSNVEVGAKASGKLVSVLVRDGDSVTAGQLLATLDTSTLQANLRQALAGVQSARAQLSQAEANAVIGPSKSSAALAQAQAQLRSARAQLKKAQAGARPEERAQAEQQVKSAKSALDTSEKALERAKTLYEGKAISRAELEQAQNAYNGALAQYNSALQSQLVLTNGTRSEDLAVAQEGVSQAEEQVRSALAQKRLDVLLRDQVNAARAQVQSAQAQVDAIRQSIEDTVIRAPFSGKVSGNPMQVGSVVGPGTPVVRIIGGSGAYFEGQVPESDIAKIAPGNPVQITVNALPGKTFSGSIAAISPLGEQVGRLFAVRISFGGTTEGVRPGMFAHGNVNLRSIPNAILVPNTAIVLRDGKPVVFLYDGKDGVRLAPITQKLKQGDLVQVDGISATDQIVVKGQEGLEPTSKVVLDKGSQGAGTTSATGG